MECTASRPLRLIAYAAVTISVFALIAVAFYRKGNNEAITYTRLLMGTVVEVTLMEGDRAGFDRAAESAFAEIGRLESLLSNYRPDSDVSRINAAAGHRVNVSDETIETIGYALKAAELSDGAFDPTVGALGRLWGYSSELERVPEKDAVAKFLPLVDYRAVSVDRAVMEAGLDRKGMAMNLGGVAKGYIAGKAVSALREAGVERGIVKAGGDMFVFQGEGAERPFIIGIQDPRGKGALGAVRLLNGAVSTSGDYERYFIKDGVRYHHILDPKTGYPARGVMSVTIVAEDPAMADALSTAVFVMGRVRGMALIERLDRVEGVIVDEAGGIFASSGMNRLEASDGVSIGDTVYQPAW
jgi:thiamine biosynthesis lipoprotein